MAFRELKQAGELSAKTLLPDGHLPDRLPQGLPDPEEMQGMARARALKAVGTTSPGIRTS